MAHIKKLFLTLSLLAMQSTFGMAEKPDEWTLVTSEQDLDQRVGTFMVIDRYENPTPYYVHPFEPEDDDIIEPSRYSLIDCKGEDDLLSSDIPLKVRGLKLEELPMVKLGGEVKYADEPVVPNEIRLNSLTIADQAQYIHKRLRPLFSLLPQGLMGQFIKNVRKENPVLKSNAPLSSLPLADQAQYLHKLLRPLSSQLPQGLITGPLVKSVCEVNPVLKFEQ